VLCQHEGLGMCSPDSHFIVSKTLLIVDQHMDEKIFGFDLDPRVIFKCLIASVEKWA
jgi:hypothetical protein